MGHAPGDDDVGATRMQDEAGHAMRSGLGISYHEIYRHLELLLRIPL
jgi:hypothetical protein